ncbi:hydrogenase maturation protease [Mycobacterium gastri]|uniref:Peptidase M52 n=1 Tax=Mycobacterium gastri TaxID=1777 RepID=A0A1X1W1P9_MYCGS|nr:hydrogenase maturation protease [Mycobacterium gastri]ETW22415.1 peptidase M52 [Mycobacterium gastri 'Wayne']ORV80165.1 peptidase M52 [Mycobacterium gastri]
MTAGVVVVVGLGNRYRRDDGVGVAAAAALDELALPNVVVVTDIVEPMSLLEAWSGAGLAIVIDAAVATPPMPGRVSRCAISDLAAHQATSSHRVDLAATYALGKALERVPDALTLLTVEVADTGHGVGLTPQVEAAMPRVIGMAVDEIEREVGSAADVSC